MNTPALLDRIRVNDLTRVAFVFDADGVLIDGPPFTERLEIEHGIPPSALNSFFRELYPQCATGKLDLLEALAPTLDEIGWAGSTMEFLAFWFQTENRPNHPILHLASNLKEAGSLVFVATNQERLRLQFLRERMGFRHRFHRIFASCEVGTMKPSPDFYYSVEQSFKDAYDIESTVFLDDSFSNTKAAETAGWLSYHYQGVEAAETLFEPLLMQLRGKFER